MSVLGEYADEIDGSLQAQYAPHDPIARFLRGEITLRALRVLINALPLDSAYVRAVRGHAWTDTEWLLHDVSSQLRWMRVEDASRHVQKRQPDPKLIPTPLDGRDVADAIEDEYREQQHVEFSAFAAALDPDINDEN